MRCACLLALVVIGAAFGRAPTFADPAYTAEEIIEKFKPAILGEQRGICVGTEAECGGTENRIEAPVQNLSVTFDLDSATLTASAIENLDQFAIALKDPLFATVALSIDGHTDARGSDPYNMSLSERRAQAVADYLGSKGIDITKFVVRGFGRSQPLTADPFDPANRRVEAHLAQ